MTGCHGKHPAHTQDKETNLRAECPLALAVLSAVGASYAPQTLCRLVLIIFADVGQAFSPRRLSLSVQSGSMRSVRTQFGCAAYASAGHRTSASRPSDPREAGRIVGEPRYGIGERLFCRRRRKNKTNRIGARHVGLRSFFQSCFEPEMSRLNAAHRDAIG